MAQFIMSNSNVSLSDTFHSSLLKEIPHALGLTKKLIYKTTMLTSGCDGPFYLINISAFPIQHYIQSTMVQCVSTNPSALTQISKMDCLCVRSCTTLNINYI